jgi:hypothetical protein
LTSHPAVESRRDAFLQQAPKSIAPEGAPTEAREWWRGLHWPVLRYRSIAGAPSGRSFCRQGRAIASRLKALHGASNAKRGFDDGPGDAASPLTLSAIRIWQATFVCVRR